MLRRMKNLTLGVLFALILSLTGFSSTVCAFEDVTGGGSSGSSSLFGGEVSQDDQDVGNWIKNQRGMTGQQLDVASKTLAPLTNIMGNIVGGIVVIIFGAVFVITALDLLYIAFPPVRNLLYKGGGAGGMQGAGGGMMGGYGGMRGGMGGYGGMGSMNQGMVAESRPLQLISDEAIQCVALLNNGGAQPQMGGMAGMQQQMSGQTTSMKSVIGVYFKKRIFFMILLAVCVIVLTSSVLLGTGVNLANWITKIISSVNNNIPK